jgi:transposase
MVKRRDVKDKVWSESFSAATEKGAKASANIYSLVETAKANNVEPSVYLKEVFTRLPAATCVEDIEALLHWNIVKVVR